MSETLSDLQKELSKARIAVADLEKRVSAEQERLKSVPTVRWIPICDAYATSDTCSVKHEKGGDTIRLNKYEQAKVLFWVRVLIDPTHHKPVQILDIETVNHKDE